MGELLDVFDHSTTEVMNGGRGDIRVGRRLSTLLDSSAIGVLMSINSRSSHRRDLVLEHQDNERISRMFAITKLDGLFEHPKDDDPDVWTAGRGAPLVAPVRSGEPGNAKLPDPRRQDPDE